MKKTIICLLASTLCISALCLSGAALNRHLTDDPNPTWGYDEDVTPGYVLSHINKDPEPWQGLLAYDEDPPMNH